MDSPNKNASILSCLSAVRDRKRRAPNRYGHDQVILPKRFCFSPPIIPQKWSIAEPIIYYIAKNPKSPYLYEKLIRSCKYFFYKNRMITISNLKFISRDNNQDIWEIEQGDMKQKINLNTTTARFWITHEIDISVQIFHRNLLSSLIPNIYQCDAYVLKLYHQNISYNEYIFLTKKTAVVEFYYVTIKYDDGTVVPFEKCLDAAINAKKFTIQVDYDDTSISQQSFRNLLKIQHFSNLQKFAIFNTPEIFDIESWFTFIKTNNKMACGLSFPAISELFKIRLEEIVDEILTTAEHNYVPPIIHFIGMDNQKFEQLLKI